MPYTYDWPRPSVTVDALVLARPAAGGPRELLLIRRDRPPFQGQWAIPGGFVDMDEDLEPAARRELEEETGLRLPGVPFVQFRTYGRPGRDPRGRTISIVFVVELAGPAPRVEGSDDASEARWFAARELPGPLAFDHDLVVREALEWLEGGAPGRR